MCGKQKADSVNFVIFDFVSEWKIRAFPLGKYWPCQRKINILFASRLIEDDNGGTKNRVHLLFEHFAWQRCAAGSILIFSLERVISSIWQHTKYLLFTMAITNDHVANAPTYTADKLWTTESRGATLRCDNIIGHRHHIGFTLCTTVMYSLFHAILLFGNIIVFIILSIFIFCWFIIISVLFSIFPHFCFIRFVCVDEIDRSCGDGAQK